MADLLDIGEAPNVRFSASLQNKFIFDLDLRGNLGSVSVVKNGVSWRFDFKGQII